MDSVPGCLRAKESLFTISALLINWVSKRCVALRKGTKQDY